MTKYTVKELKKGMKNIEIEVTVDFLGEKRKTDGFNNDTFQVGFVKDETGDIKLVFWNDDVKKVKEGKKLKIVDGYVTEFRDTLQLNASKEKGIKWL